MRRAPRRATLDGGGSAGSFPAVQFLPFKYYIPHLVFFGVFLAALAPVLYYYQRRNPNPRFRPGVGEMTMIAVFALFVGGLASWFLGNFFRGDQRSPEKFDHGAGWSSGSTAPPGKDNSRSQSGKE